MVVRLSFLISRKPYVSSRSDTDDPLAENCRNEHPGARGGGGGGGYGSQNRYAPLSGNNRYGGGGSGNSRKDIWQFNPDDVPNDLTAGKGRPQWILSSYGPGKNAPASLLQDNEFSSEEVRVRFYELAAQGKQDEGDREAIALWSKAEQDMNQVVNNARDVEKFMREAEKKHPNRDDFTQVDGTKTREEVIKEAESSPSSNTGSGFGSNTPSGAFGSNANTNPFAPKTASAFGQPSQPSSGFGSSPFSKPAFGQSGFGGASPSGGAFGQAGGGSSGSNASSGGFGKPAFGQSGSGFGSPGFGQPSQPSSAFGQPSQPSSAFGKPSIPSSTFGQPSRPSSGFGQPAFGSSGFGSNAPKNSFAAPSASGGFGSNTPSAFGQPPQPTSAFGQPSQPVSAFGQPSQPGSAFGQPSQPTSAFGQPSQPTSAFGQPSQPTSAFGQPAQPSTAFGKPTLTSFGQPSGGQTSAGFGSNASPGFGTSPAPSFGQPSAPTNPFGAKQADEPIVDENMEATSPAVSRPQSRANPFGVAPAPMAPAQPPQPAPTARPLAHTNSSTTPHPLTSQPPHALHYTQSLPQGPMQKNPAQQLTIYRGQPVTYIKDVPYYRRPDTRELEKIWFPNGGAEEPVQALNNPAKVQDTQGEAAEYTEDVVGRYKHLFETGTWKDGKIPLVPPLREWDVYDF
ncbi:hypothetical protein H2200_004426 [Cladophialophora chaetospira]|uniref:CCCH zinc finger domain protein n=1 Tax=Cladophialophora chaetospira TaxID=386627 RepID=A0AA38XD41_9EURO|nr:hypothetical protein H2200_004426 [Cladophialophora chaetospira]